MILVYVITDTGNYPFRKFAFNLDAAKEYVKRMISKECDDEIRSRKLPEWEITQLLAESNSDGCWGGWFWEHDEKNQTYRWLASEEDDSPWIIRVAECIHD